MRGSTHFRTNLSLGVDTDYQAVLDYASSNSIPLPTTQQQELDNQFILDAKSSGLWDRSDVVVKLKSTADIAFRRICFKRLIQVDVLGAGTWSDLGYKGNGTNAYINPKAPLNTLTNYTQNDASVSWFCFDNDKGGTTTSGCTWGLYNSGSISYHFLVLNRTGGDFISINSDGANVSGNSSNASGFASVNRINSTQIRVIGTHSGTGAPFDYTDASASLSLQANTPYFMARHRADLGRPDSYSYEGLSYLFMGASIADIHNDIKAIL